MRDSEDLEIFQEAKNANVIVMTKDSDFVSLRDRLGSPPKIIWLTCGNTSNTNLKTILSDTLPKAFELLESGENIVEIS